MGGGGLGGLDLLSVDMVRCSASEGMAAEALALLPGALGCPPFPSVVMALSVRLFRRQVRSLIQFPVRFLQSEIFFFLEKGLFYGYTIKDYVSCS